MTDVESAIAELGIAVVRVDRGRQARAACPLCPAEGKGGEAFSVNLEDGRWNCHRCHETGNLFTLRRRLRGVPSVGPAVPSPRREASGRVIPEAEVQRLVAGLVASPRAREYLERIRRLPPDVYGAARLGFDPVRGEGGAVAIPYFSAGACVGVKYRRLSPGDAERKYDREPGCVLPLYGVDSLDGAFGRVVVVEGEMDRLAMLTYGVEDPVVSLPDGASAGLKDDAKAALVAFDEVVLATDQDAAGDDAALRVAGEVGRFRCRRARLPRKDAGDCLAAGVPREEILAAISGAADVATSLVRPASAWREALLNPPPNPRGFPTGHSGLDALLGGFRPGEVTLLTADTGHGKSTLCVDLVRRQVEAGRASLVVSLELGGRAVARKLLSSVAGRLWDRIGTEGLVAAVDRLCALPAYVLDRYGDVRIDLLRDEISYAVRRYGVEFVVVDHLHFALGVRRPGEDERLLIDAAAHAVQVCALEHGIHVVLVAHPAKIRPGEDGASRRPRAQDIKGSSGPAQYADNVAVVARLPGSRATLEFEKVRSELGRPGRIDLLFDPETLRFTEA